MDFGRRREEPGSLKSGPVAQVFRFQVVGLLEIVEGLFVVLPRLGILTLVVSGRGRIHRLCVNRKPQANQEQNKKSRTNQASHQTVLIKIFSPAGFTSRFVPANDSFRHTKTVPEGCPSGQQREKVLENRIIASPLLAPEVVGRAMVTLVSTGPSEQVSGVRSQEKQRLLIFCLSMRRLFLTPST